MGGPGEHPPAVFWLEAAEIDEVWGIEILCEWRAPDLGAWEGGEGDEGAGEGRRGAVDAGGDAVHPHIPCRCAQVRSVYPSSSSAPLTVLVPG